MVMMMMMTMKMMMMMMMMNDENDVNYNDVNYNDVNYNAILILQNAHAFCLYIMRTRFVYIKHAHILFN